MVPWHFSLKCKKRVSFHRNFWNFLLTELDCETMNCEKDLKEIKNGFFDQIENVRKWEVQYKYKKYSSSEADVAISVGKFKISNRMKKNPTCLFANWFQFPDTGEMLNLMRRLANDVGNKRFLTRQLLSLSK